MQRPAPVVDDVLQLIGDTPLLELAGVAGDGAATVLAKAEHLNPGGSVKDRPCLAMIEAAERQGRLRPGDTVVEPTSGNTGIGLALVCAVKRYRLVLTMPESMSLERRALLQAFGAELVLTPAEQVMQGAIIAAQRIAEERGAFMPQQFDNPENPASHAHGTAAELLRALPEGALHAFVAAVGTGGTISGVGGVLRRERPAVHIVAVEPESSQVLAGKPPGPTKLQGIGAGFVPRNFHPEVMDELMPVSDADAYAMKSRLARQHGLLVGMTAAANVWAAAVVARRLGPGKAVVTVLCDTGERYFSLDEHFGRSALLDSATPQG